MNERKLLVSKAISYVCEAPFLAIPTFLILNLLLNQNNFLEIAIICLFFGTIIPILVLFTWSKFKKIDRDFTIKEDRNRPLLMAVVIYLIGTFVLYFSSANPLIISLMFLYATNTLIVFFINLKWKISVHSMGIAGPTTVLMFINPWFFIVGLIGPLIMWSRLILKKHTIGQVLAGSFLGYILTATQLYYITKLIHFNVNVDIFLILLCIIGLTLPPLFLLLRSYLKDNVVSDRTRIIFYCIVCVSLLVFLSFSSFAPIIALILSGMVSILVSHFLN